MKPIEMLQVGIGALGRKLTHFIQERPSFRITLMFRASVGEGQPEDTVEIVGQPTILSSVKGRINGDIATCAITLNALPRLLEASPGLRTMIDIPVVSYFS